MVAVLLVLLHLLLQAADVQAAARGRDRPGSTGPMRLLRVVPEAPGCVLLTISTQTPPHTLSILRTTSENQTIAQLKRNDAGEGEQAKTIPQHRRG